MRAKQLPLNLQHYTHQCLKNIVSKLGDDDCIKPTPHLRLKSVSGCDNRWIHIDHFRNNGSILIRIDYNFEMDDYRVIVRNYISLDKHHHSYKEQLFKNLYNTLKLLKDLNYGI